MYAFYLAPTTLDEAFALKAHYGDQARVLAGGTDLLLEIERGVRHTPTGTAPGVIDLTRIEGLATIREEDGLIHLGPLVTHNQCVASPLIVQKAFPLARACWEVGAPQIRNRATVAGNLITGSPANDAIVPLLALDASVTVQSAAARRSTLRLNRFLTGFRQVDLAPDEILTGISFPALSERQAGVFIKLGLRPPRPSAWSAWPVVVARGEVYGPVTWRPSAWAPWLPWWCAPRRRIVSCRQSARSRSDYGRSPLAVSAASFPIDDVRAPAAYRTGMVEALVAPPCARSPAAIARGWPAAPILLWGTTDGTWPVVDGTLPTPLPPGTALVNG